MKEKIAKSFGLLFDALVAGGDTTAWIGEDIADIFANTKPEKLVVDECEGNGQSIGAATANWWVKDAVGIQFKGTRPYPDSFDGDDLFRTFPLIKFSHGGGTICIQLRMGMMNAICVQAKVHEQGDGVIFDTFETVYRYRDGVRS